MYLSDTDDTMGPMGIVPKSHLGELYNMYDDSHTWLGCLRDEDVLKTDPTKHANFLTGKAGTVTVHNCRCIHGSLPNKSNKFRPLLLNAYSSCDAVTLQIGSNTILSKDEMHGTIVRGKPAEAAIFDPRPCPLPPQVIKGSLFKAQRKEEALIRGQTNGGKL